MNNSFCNICTIEGPNYPVLSASQFWEQESFACLVNALVKCRTCSLIMCYNCIKDGNEQNPGSFCYQRCGTSLNPLDTYNDIKYQNFQIEPQSDNDCIRQSLYKQEQMQQRYKEQTVAFSTLKGLFTASKDGPLTCPQSKEREKLVSCSNIDDIHQPVIQQIPLDLSQKELQPLIQENSIQTTEDPKYAIAYISEDKLQIDTNIHPNIQQELETNIQIIGQTTLENITQMKVQMFTRKFINTYKKQISNIDIQINENQVSFDIQLPNLVENREIVDKKYTVKYNLQILQGIPEQQDKVTPISFNQLTTCRPDHGKMIQDSIKQFICNNINIMFNKYAKTQLITLNYSQMQFISKSMQYRTLLHCPTSQINEETAKTEVCSTLIAFKAEYLPIQFSDIKSQNEQQLYQTKLSLLRMGLTQQFVDLIQYRLQDVNVTSTLVDCQNTLKKDSTQGIYIESNNSIKEDQNSNSPRSAVVHEQSQLNEHLQPLVRSIQSISECDYQVVDNDQSLRCDSFKRRKVDTESEYICDENELYWSQDSETSYLINKRTTDHQIGQYQNCVVGESPVYIKKRTYLMRKEQVISSITVKLELLKQINQSTYDSYRNYAKMQMIQSQDKIDPNSQEYINMQHSLSNLIPTLSVCVYYKQ